MSGLPKGHWFHYFAIAGNLHVLESLLVYSLVLGVLLAPPQLTTLFHTNCLVQLCLFVPFVQIPVALTGHMAYVDIGWPSGLVAISLVALFFGTGHWQRRWLMSGCYFLHGGRMALGAVVMFGQATRFTYRFKADLPRYRYAKHKWLKDGMPEKMWWLKMQQDTLGQGFSNSVLLCVPAFLAASNPETTLHPVEWLGFLVWLVSWLFESTADLQKMKFMEEQKRHQGEPATLGVAPFDKYFLWSLCRHPNYFGEWMAWFGFSIASFPSLSVIPDGYRLAALSYFLAIVLIPRLLYDCLVHWTGAGPAEHYSVQKRPNYMDFQKNVRCFFPFQMPFVDHHQYEGWPSFEVTPKSSWHELESSGEIVLDHKHDFVGLKASCGLLSTWSSCGGAKKGGNLVFAVNVCC